MKIGLFKDSFPAVHVSRRFRPMTVFHEVSGDESGFTCCAFSACERFVMLGTCLGHLKLYNTFSGKEVASHRCHTSAITHLEPSRVLQRSEVRMVIGFNTFVWHVDMTSVFLSQDGKLVLTSASWSVPLSVLWSLDGGFNLK